MPRPQRHTPAGVTNHVIQRGNNRQLCFLSETDFRTYLYWLAFYAAEYHVDVHAWVLMPNHIHLLCTPQTTGALSKLMQSLGRKYVRYFNFSHQRTGTLWEGRFKSFPVLTNEYLWQLFRYIELNPVRAKLCSTALDYPWSSHRFNAFGTPCNLGTLHPLLLGITGNGQCHYQEYRNLFALGLSDAQLHRIRNPEQLSPNNFDPKLLGSE